MKPLAISIIQSDIFWEDKAKNLAALEQEIARLTIGHIVILPEMFSTGFTMNIDLAEEPDGPTVGWMRKVAARSRKIITGSVMTKDKGHFYNRLVWMLPNGTFHQYDKAHLFSYAGEDRHFTPGKCRVVVSVNGWKILLQVCYDLRFPVWSRQTEDLYDVLINVANWPQTRSLAWKTLLQARAIENQCYVAGVNRIGEDGLQNKYSGDSMLIDPQGEIIKQASGREMSFTVTLDKEYLNHTRRKFPFLNDADRFLLL